MEHNSDIDVHQLVLTSLPHVIDHVGTQTFYTVLARLITQYLKSHRYMVIRYARFARPKFIVNNAMTDEAVANYLAQFYRIDPLLRMAREETKDTVVTFSELRRDAQDTLFYDEMFRTAEIRDELVFLLPTVGGVSIAICVDRSRRHFSDRELEAARAIYPLLNRLHALHINENLRSSTGRTLEDPDVAMMIFDANSNALFRNAAWRDRFSASQEPEPSAILDARSTGSVWLDNNVVLHWERLGDTNGIAPDGLALVAEDSSPGYVNLSRSNWKDDFALKYDLTPREIEIVAMQMSGQPTARIATALNISPGTVRNHKHRLYLKLDITTERELLCMVFEEIVGSSPENAA